jgi:hypothetical protein
MTMVAVDHVPSADVLGAAATAAAGAVVGAGAPSGEVFTVWLKPWLPAAAAAAVCACAVVGDTWASVGGGGGGAGALGADPNAIAVNLSKWLEPVVCRCQLVHVLVRVILCLCHSCHWFVC